MTPVHRVEQHYVSVVAGRQSALSVGAAQHAGRVDRAGGERLPRRHVQLRAGKRADERQALAERAAGVEVRGQGHCGPCVYQVTSRGHGTAEEERARREQHTHDVACGERANALVPVASRWSTERAPSSTASGIAPAP